MEFMPFYCILRSVLKAYSTLLQHFESFRIKI